MEKIKVKYKQTNKKEITKNATKVTGKLDFEQKSFFVAHVADIFSALEIYST